MQATGMIGLFLASSASALVSRSDQCCFGITATGGPGGKVGQLSDGQNRIGQGLQPAQYCIENGAITDGSGRGCILTPPTTQFQCDQGAAAQGGFAVGCDGSVTYNGSPQFYACQTGDNGGYDIYTESDKGQAGCTPVTLNGDSCHANCPAPPPMTTSALPSAPKPTSCSTGLSGPYEYPHLIVQMDSDKPTSAPGTSYFGQVSPTISSIFNFDIPGSDAGKTCSLVFLFPDKKDLTTSAYNVSGPGTIGFSMLSSPATQQTSAGNAPAAKQDYGVQTVAPGNSYPIATFPCPAAQAVAFEMKSQGGTSLQFFQDYNPAPIGMYITVCKVQDEPM